MCHRTLTFFTLKKWGSDFFGVFNYGTGTFSATLSFGNFLGIHGYFKDS